MVTFYLGIMLTSTVEVLFLLAFIRLSSKITQNVMNMDFIEMGRNR